METMKAVVIEKHGSPDVLQIKDIDRPIPKDNEVLIKLIATTVTSGDVALRRQSFLQFLLIWPIARFIFGVKNQRKKILGHEFCGEIEYVGKAVNNFKKGDYVMGTTGFAGGGYAQYICLPEKSVMTVKPATISNEEAAAITIGGICALSFLRKGAIQRGQNVLIYGASGSIGTFAIQLATYFGAEVTGVCSTKNVALVKTLGAHQVIDYTSQDFTTCSEKYDMIFDTVGKLSHARCKKVLKEKGRFLSTHSSPVQVTIESLEFLKELIEQGKLKSVIDTCYSLEQIVEAHQYVEEGHKVGNVVITIDHHN